VKLSSVHTNEGRLTGLTALQRTDRSTRGSSLSLPLITTPSIYSTTSYHHRQLLLKAKTSGTELITDLLPIVLDIS